MVLEPRGPRFASSVRPARRGPAPESRPGAINHRRAPLPNDARGASAHYTGRQPAMVECSQDARPHALPRAVSCALHGTDRPPPSGAGTGRIGGLGALLAPVPGSRQPSCCFPVRGPRSNVQDPRVLYGAMTRATMAPRLADRPLPLGRVGRVGRSRLSGVRFGCGDRWGCRQRREQALTNVRFVARRAPSSLEHEIVPHA